MEKQVIPQHLVEKVHQVMNYLSCFSSDLQMNEYITAEEFYLALDNMNKHEKFDQLINYLAGTFVMAMFREIKSKNKHQDYLSYEYDYRILKQMRSCFKKIDDNVKTFMEMWRQFLVFLLLVKPFRKAFLIPNYSSSSSIRRDIDEEEDEEEEEGNLNPDNNDSSKLNEEEDESENKSNLSSAEKQEQKYKKKDLSKEDLLYEHYNCRSIQDTDSFFADFSTLEKLEAFLILVKIAYRFSFCLTYNQNRYKNQIKDEEIKTLRNQIIEKEEQRDEAKKQIEEGENLLNEYTKDVQGDISQLPNDKLQQYKKEKVKLNPLRQKFEKIEKSLNKLNADLTLKRRNQFFQFSNWVFLGKDRNKNQFYACSYETGYVFKKIFKQIDEESQLECHMFQFDNMASLRSELNLNNIADDQLWDKINQLNSNCILTIPEQKQPIEIEQDQYQDSESSNMSRKDQISNYYKAKSKLIQQNITTRDFSFIKKSFKLQQSSKHNSTKKSVNINMELTIDDLQDFTYNKRVTRSQLSGNKRKKIIIDDDDEDDENFSSNKKNAMSKKNYNNQTSSDENSDSEEDEF